MMNPFHFYRIREYRSVEVGFTYDEVIFSAWWVRLIVTLPRIGDRERSLFRDHLLVSYTGDIRWTNVGFLINSFCICLSIGKIELYFYPRGCDVW